MTAVFIRHAESQANAGEACEDFALIALTDKGREQAAALAYSWERAPDLFIHSPYLRTYQTAAATLERFSEVPVEVWPVQEFTNLSPTRWNGSLPHERTPRLKHFWQRCDPAFRDDVDAETFEELVDRARGTLLRLQSLPENTLVYVFSHGFFMNAIRSFVEYPTLDTETRMRDFVPAFRERPILNTERMTLVWRNDQWQFSDNSH